jgi:hypothetical protein
MRVLHAWKKEGGEIMSLREKAKTSYSVCEEAYLTCEVCEPRNKCGSGNCPLVNVLWVRVEDAEQAIAKLKQEYLANIMEEDRRQQLRIQELNKEYEELKQKLQQLLNEFPDINDEKYKFSAQEFIVDTYPMLIYDVFRWKKKFEGC